jgi:hypothetical protein
MIKNWVASDHTQVVYVETPANSDIPNDAQTPSDATNASGASEAQKRERKEKRDYNKNYIVTSAQYDAGVHDRFLDGLKRLSDERDAELIVLPMEGKSRSEEDLDESLFESGATIEYRKRHLNSNIQINSFRVAPQQIDPTTGLARFAQSDVTTIFAGTKQRMRCIPNSNEKLTRVLMTTGAVTHPRYRDNRLGKIAELDHRYGALLVEVEDKNLYHYRNIQATNKGDFVDLGVRYQGSEDLGTSRLEAMIVGDTHFGDTDPQVRAAVYEMIEQLRPRRVFLHDFFNGHSVSHHTEENLRERWLDFRDGRLDLERELIGCANELRQLSQLAPDAEFVVVGANHNEFLDRYLSDAKRFGKDYANIDIACKIMPRYLREGNAFKVGIETVSEGDLPKNITFLNRDKDYKVLGWQLGSHGDKGPNGAKTFSVRSKENAYGKSITGHTHTPEIFRNTYSVGTSTLLKLRYNVGPSSWMHTHALLYDTGKVQLINVIDGKWRKQYAPQEAER